MMFDTTTSGPTFLRRQQEQPSDMCHSRKGGNPLLLFFFLLMFSTSLVPASLSTARLTQTAMRAAEQAHRQATWQRSAVAAAAWELPQERLRSTAWEYWAMSLGAGVAGVFRDDPFIGRSYTWVPDVAIALERSWYLTDQFTAIIDVSLICPTVRLGYILNEQSRVSLGIGAWFYSFWGYRPFTLFMLEEMKLRGGGGVAVKELDDGPYHRNLEVTPSLAFDHFLSKNCFLRVMASYDQLYTMRDEQKIMIHWPQVTCALNFKF